MKILKSRRGRAAGQGQAAEVTRAPGSRRALRSRWPVPVAFSVLAAGAVLAVPAAASASPLPSHGHGHGHGYVYLNDNTAGSNTVAAFSRNANGTLTPLPGSPFTAGGAGTGAGLASQGAVQVADGGRFLLVADAGSNQISALRIERNGSLRLASTVSSDGTLPVSIAVHGSLVYVANVGPANSDYAGFRLGDSGNLMPLAGSTVALPADAQPGDVVFNGTGTRLIGARVGTSQIDSFTVGPDGRLTAAPGSPFTAQGLGPFGSQFRPTRPDQLFVANAHNGAGLGTVSAFADSPDGVLTSVGNSPVADQQTAPCWVTVSPDGRYLFAVNTGSGTISRYSISAGGALKLLGTTAIAGGSGVVAVDAGMSHDGRFLYVNESKARSVGAFAVSGSGGLTELPGPSAALPAGATPAGIAVS